MGISGVRYVKIVHAVQESMRMCIQLSNALHVSALERDLLDGVVERLSLDGGNLELELRGLARAVGAREGTSAPGRSYK